MTPEQQAQLDQMQEAISATIVEPTPEQIEQESFKGTPEEFAKRKRSKARLSQLNKKGVTQITEQKPQEIIWQNLIQHLTVSINQLVELGVADHKKHYEEMTAQAKAEFQKQHDQMMAEAHVDYQKQLDEYKQTLDEQSEVQVHQMIQAGITQMQEFVAQTTKTYEETIESLKKVHQEKETVLLERIAQLEQQLTLAAHN
jgi:hypothetical protein